MTKRSSPNFKILTFTSNPSKKSTSASSRSGALIHAIAPPTSISFVSPSMLSIYKSSYKRNVYLCDSSNWRGSKMHWRQHTTFTEGSGRRMLDGRVLGLQVTNKRGAMMWMKLEEEWGSNSEPRKNATNGSYFLPAPLGITFFCLPPMLFTKSLYRESQFTILYRYRTTSSVLSEIDMAQSIVAHSLFPWQR